jgi:hypothetical protein
MNDRPREREKKSYREREREKYLLVSTEVTFDVCCGRQHLRFTLQGNTVNIFVDVGRNIDSKYLHGTAEMALEV